MLSLVLICSDFCFSQYKVIEEGLICCNYSICDKYCYKNECIQANKVWFCYKEGIGYFFLIKFVPSILFFFIGILIRIYYHKKEKINFLLLIFGKECYMNTYLFVNINGYFCHEVYKWLIIAIIFTIVGFIIFLCSFILNYQIYTFSIQRYKASFNHNQFFYNVKQIILNFWVIIFTITGYFMVFDTFAFLLNKYYRYKSNNIDKYLDVYLSG